MAEGDAKRWLKYGCFGCLGIVGLVFVAVVLVVGLAWLRSRSEKVEDRVWTQTAPEASAGPTGAETAPVEKQAPKAPGRVILDLRDAEFRVRPGAAGEPIRVEATYDTNSFDLDENTEEGADGTWTCRVEFRSTRSSTFMDMLQRIFSANRARVTVTLPPDVPVALEARVERGGLHAELGGLWLTSAALRVSMGGLEVSVEEPLAAPMERLEVKTEMGGGQLRSIGNASPRVLDLEYSMGGMELDLSGAWSADAEISLRGSMGGARVRLPKGVRIEGVPDVGLEGPRSDELKVPTLRFSTSSEMGEVKFE